MFCTRDDLPRQLGILYAGGTTLVAEQWRSQRLRCNERDATYRQRRREAAQFRQGNYVYGTVADNGAGGLRPNADRLTLIVDSGASDRLLVDERILRLLGSMRDFTELEKPKSIVTAGNQKVIATATGAI